MRKCRTNLPNRCCHLTSRFVRRAFEGVQAANLRNLGSVPSHWLGGSVVRWLGSCANPQHETHTSSPENEGLVPKAPIPKCRIILRGQANIMQIACAVAGSVPRFSAGEPSCASPHNIMQTLIVARRRSMSRRSPSVLRNSETRRDVETDADF